MEIEIRGSKQTFRRGKEAKRIGREAEQIQMVMFRKQETIGRARKANSATSTKRKAEKERLKRCQIDRWKKRVHQKKRILERIDRLK